MKKVHSMDIETVKHIAHLVRLGITEAEADEFSRQFNSIIDYFNMLNEVDTQTVPPASDAAYSEIVLREDLVGPSMDREEFLRNAPRSERGHIVVPTVLFDE